MQKKYKKAIIIVSSFIILIGAYFTFKYYLSSSHKTSFLTAPVIKGDIEEGVLATGKLDAFTQIDVGAQVSGQIKSLKVTLGDSVKKGDLLAEIDPVLQQNTLRTAQAQLDSAAAQYLAKQALLKQSELALARQQKMMTSNATSHEELESAQASVTTNKADLMASEAKIREARIQVDTAHANIGYTKISAPIDGEVVAIITKEGQTVVSTQTAPIILKLADVSTMTVMAQVSEADVIRVSPGQTIYFTVLGAPEKRFYAKLRAIEPAPDSINKSSTEKSTNTAAVYYNGLFDVANPDHLLRIGMTAQVFIIQGEVKNVLTIPASALGIKNKTGLYQVSVLKNENEIEMRLVKIGLNNNINAEVLEGLEENELVIIGNNALDSDTIARMKVNPLPPR